MPETHYLKTDPQVFADVRAGRKTHEIRLNDRNFQAGDALVLQETTFTGAEIRAGKPLKYTDEVETRVVSHIQTGYGLMPDWVILSFAQ